MEQESGSLVWRGDAEYYRRRLASAFTYDVILEMTCHSYVMALGNNPFLDMRNHATYLSTVFADVSEAKARADMAALIASWINEGLVAIPDEIRMMADEGQICLPFEIPSECAQPPTLQ